MGWLKEIVALPPEFHGRHRLAARSTTRRWTARRPPHLRRANRQGWAFRTNGKGLRRETTLAVPTQPSLLTTNVYRPLSMRHIPLEGLNWADDIKRDVVAT